MNACTSKVYPKNKAYKREIYMNDKHFMKRNETTGIVKLALIGRNRTEKYSFY